MSTILGQLANLRKDRLGVLGVAIFLLFVLIAVFAPYIAPYDPMEILEDEEGNIIRMVPPSASHLFGTTRMGRDIFSQVVWGSRVAMLVGLLASVIVVFLGCNIGLISGFFGGKTDNILMRITDISYGLPFLPFAIILVAILGPGLTNIIVTISLIMWRTTARVIRSQVLSIKTRAFVESARVSGASDWQILYQHVAPNVIPIAFVYVPLTMADAILTEASLSFLGYGDPMLMSWGKTIYEAWTAGAVYVAWWWTFFPGVAIMLLVLSSFLTGRALEEIVNPKLRQR